MREKYESLSVSVLRDLAKSRGIGKVTSMKKAELVEAMLAKDEEEKKQSSGTAGSAPKTEGKEKTFPGETEMSLDSGITTEGILEVMPDGYGFIRCENYLPGEKDVYVSPSQIRKFDLKTGDIIKGNTRVKTQGEKFSALLYVKTINGYHPSEAQKRKNFEDLTPIFPDERLHLDHGRGTNMAMRIVDLVSPIGKGQRGMIVSPPKAGKTTLLKAVAKSIVKSNPEMHLIILLIDERPEEVTDIKEAICGDNVEVIYSTFDELPEHHRRVSEMVIERAKRLVEHKRDVMILLDSITRLARAYNLVVPPSGRTLSGGLDPAALHMPKRFFGAARNMREGSCSTDIFDNDFFSFSCTFNHQFSENTQILSECLTSVQMYTVSFTKDSMVFLCLSLNITNSTPLPNHRFFIIYNVNHTDFKAFPIKVQKLSLIIHRLHKDYPVFGEFYKCCLLKFTFFCTSYNPYLFSLFNFPQFHLSYLLNRKTLFNNHSNFH